VWCHFVLLLVYLFFNPEHELLHWLTLAVAFHLVQLFNRDQRVGLASALVHPRGWLLVPRALLLPLGTAATTEEIFFRGVLQTRLAARTGFELAALWIGTPYASLNRLSTYPPGRVARFLSRAPSCRAATGSDPVLEIEGADREALGTLARSPRKR
jgi:CAAX prenyl protease-like protein